MLTNQSSFRRDADEIDAFQMTDFPLYQSRHRDGSPSLRAPGGIKAEPSESKLPSLRRPRAIRPAKPATVINTQAVYSDAYASAVDTEDYNPPTYPSSHSFHDDMSSPTTSSYSDTSGEGSTAPWQTATASGFGAMEDGYANYTSTNQFRRDPPASAPVASSFTFAEAAHSPRDMTRTYSYPPVSSLQYDVDHSAHYYAHQFNYPQPHCMSYPTSYDPGIGYSPAAYYEAYNEDQGHQ